MALLIDGYNLLHVSGVFGSGRGPGHFERAREALLRLLAASLSAAERAQTTIVFDAQEAPPNLPRQYDRETMTVHFAPRESTADEMIEELLRADSSPRRLTVVSSDHRVQNAARRRRATPIDSDLWWADLLRRRTAQRQEDANSAVQKPEGSLTPNEINYWLGKFAPGLDSLDVETPRPAPPDKTKPAAQSPRTQETPEKPTLPPGNPFPPGYADDLSEDDV